MIVTISEFNEAFDQAMETASEEEISNLLEEVGASSIEELRSAVMIDMETRKGVQFIDYVGDDAILNPSDD